MSRAEEARAVIEAVKVLDRYGFTTAARIAASAAEAIAADRVNPATYVKSGAR
jgi:hypothetical protein